jgi:hypothetical protein
MLMPAAAVRSKDLAETVDGTTFGPSRPRLLVANPSETTRCSICYGSHCGDPSWTCVLAQGPC